MASPQAPLSRPSPSRLLQPHHGSPEPIVGIKEIVDQGIRYVPHDFIRPPSQRPGPVSDSEQPPVIDLAGLNGAGHSQVVAEIGRACKEWGFFQVINHGANRSAIEAASAAVGKFFEQPAEERMRFYSEDFDKEVAYMISFNRSKEKIKEWRDALYFRCIVPGPAPDFKDAPDYCRQPALDYINELRTLAARIYKAIFESLGLSAEYIEKEVAGIPRVLMATNYYPPCPDPSLTFGQSGHSDVSSLTLLLQDKVSGLQVLKGDRWVQVKPVPDSFVINVGDQIEILSNGKYKSILHRVVTNKERPRMTIACFFGPTEDATIAPVSQLITDEDPQIFKATRFADYVKNFYSKALASKTTLDFARLSTQS